MLDSGLYRGAVKGYRDAAEIEGKAFSLLTRLTRRDTGHSCSISPGAGLGSSVAAVALASHAVCWAANQNGQACGCEWPALSIGLRKPATREHMSGWQRVGVVISILWLVGVPIYFMVDQNQSAGTVYESCLQDAYLIYGPVGYKGDNPAEFRLASQRCSETRNRMFMSLKKLIGVLLGQDKESQVIWTAMFVPLALFWVIGGVVIATVRWIFRGLVHRSS